MDRIKILQSRRAKLLDATKSVRKKVTDLVDEMSFVEFDSYSFSHSDVYEEDALGDGVLTGIGTINGNNYCIVAINSEVMHGGLSLSNCNKIVKCMDKALRTASPLIYVLESNGVQLGEGVNVLEGIAKILKLSSDVKESGLMQFALVTGNLFGSLSVLVSNCDFAYALKDGKVSFTSPLVISAKNPSANAELTLEKVVSVKEFKDKVSAITDVINGEFVDGEDDLNRTAPALNKTVTDDALIKAVFDKNSFIEFNNDSVSQVKTGVAYLAGLSVATVIFDSENTVELDGKVMKKITDFLDFVQIHDLPLITFVNSKGIKQDVACQKCVLSRINDFINVYKTLNKITVITGSAIGLGYTLFASKEMNNCYSYAFVQASVGLFDEATGALVELDSEASKINEMAEEYAEKTDPINAAHNGYLDNVIEPKFVRQYVISALQTLEV